ncbi:hypothetical protein KAJ38_03530 [Candidatus Pacearchaeota archaeon]|nr:hypothetical protein [Candidatus Pacearchaeota archaeon]
MIAWLNKRIKKMDVLDIGLIKWSVAAFILFLITIWPAAMTWVQSVNPWYFLVAFVVFMIRPFYRIYLK